MKKYLPLFAALAVGLLAVPAQAAEFTVTIKDFKFDPAALELAAGDTITFINEDSAPHTATAADGSFDTGALAKGESATVTVSAAGTYDYICDLHPSMEGVVTAQ